MIRSKAKGKPAGVLATPPPAAVPASSSPPVTIVLEPSTTLGRVHCDEDTAVDALRDIISRDAVRRCSRAQAQAQAQARASALPLTPTLRVRQALAAGLPQDWVFLMRGAPLGKKAEKKRLLPVCPPSLPPL